MKNKLNLFFKNKTSEWWQNLALVALLTLYIIVGAFSLVNINETNICNNLAFDYCAYYSAGKIINQEGIDAVYDLSILTQYQKEIFPQGNKPGFEAAAFMYLPIFILPFKFLSRLDLPLGFLVWTLINLSVFIVYLWFFTKKIVDRGKSFKFILMAMLSLPFILNLYYGQVNIWPTICVGEFIRATISGKPIKAGLWLGGWLLKPQLLILIIPFLLIQRSMKILLGLATSSLVTLGISFGLVNADGFVKLINVVFDAAGGGVASSPQVMINWRMLGWHLDTLTSSSIGQAMTILGTILTMGVTLFIFRKKISQDSTKMVIALLGIFAATCTSTWHSHLPMSMILIPPMLYLSMKNRFNVNLFLLWAFLPILFQLMFNLLSAFIFMEEYVLQLEEGLRGLILNLLILNWAITAYVNESE